MKWKPAHPSAAPGALFLAAAPAEAAAVCRGLEAAAPSVIGTGRWESESVADGLHLALTGVGKANAAACAARLTDPARFGAVINLGICGSLPGGPPVGNVILATESIYADEGLITDSGFTDCAAMGFPLGEFPGGRGVSVPCSPALLEALLPLADFSGPIATVSTCSGTDSAAAAVVARTGAIAEAMEGAAIAHALWRLHGDKVHFAELRVVSNTTGRRESQVWDLKGALARLARLARSLRDG